MDLRETGYEGPWIQLAHARMQQTSVNMTMNLEVS